MDNADLIERIAKTQYYAADPEIEALVMTDAPKLAAAALEALQADLRATLDDARAEINRLNAELAEAVEGLRSIGANTCCDGCQEAALVARAMIAKLEAKP